MLDPQISILLLSNWQPRGHHVEEEEEMTDRPLGPSGVDKAVEGDGDATVLAPGY